jgi:hypothetical protein
MRTLTLDNRAVQYQWASDVNFDGIRLEVLSDDREVLFDVSVPDDGPISINTFGKEVAANLIETALAVARSRSDTRGWTLGLSAAHPE